MLKRIICLFRGHEFEDTLLQHGLPEQGWVHVKCIHCNTTAKVSVWWHLAKYANEHSDTDTSVESQENEGHDT